MAKYLDKDGVTTLWAKIKSLFAKKEEGIYYIEGTHKVNGWVGEYSLVGTDSRITHYYDGLTIAYKTDININIESTVHLNINDLGSIKISINGSTYIKNKIAKGTVIILTYITVDNISYWEKYDATVSSIDKLNEKLLLIGSPSQTANCITYTNSNVFIGTDNCLYSNGTKVSVEGHTHTTSDISGAVTTRDIFCIDLLTDLTLRELDLEGGQVILGDNLLTMGYGDVLNYSGDKVYGISISVNNGTTENWFALINNDSDKVVMQSGYGAIYMERGHPPILQDLDELSNCHIEVFTYADYEELYTTLGGAEMGYDNIQYARDNLTYLCTIRLSEDKTKWIVQ